MNITIQHTYLFNFFHEANLPIRPSIRLSTTYPSIYLSYLYRTYTERTYQPSVQNKYRIPAYPPRHRKKERKKKKSFFQPKTLDLREVLDRKI